MPAAWQGGNNLMPDGESRLPQLGNRLFLTDGGQETTLIFREGWELPCFAAITLMQSSEGVAALQKYYREYLQLASSVQAGFILEGATWRASHDWGVKLGLGPTDLQRLNRDAIALLQELRSERAESDFPIVLSGCIGPRGDGYRPDRQQTPEQAAAYHQIQVETLAAAGAELVTAMTMNTVAEALGIALAARRIGIPAVISFTVETDGRLPEGVNLQQAIERIDQATDGSVSYFMINCAHPSHFLEELRHGSGWQHRIRGIRANSSTLSHAELDEATELDEGDPRQLGEAFVQLREHLPELTVLGGCCGTDLRHVSEIARACAPLFHPRC